MKIDLEQFIVKPGKKVHLDKIDPGDISAFDGDKGEAKNLLDKLNGQLDLLQERLYAGQQEALLIVFQGMDTSGKDGVIEHVFEGVNPQGVQVASFKVPTPQELAHDFLWRIHQRMPAKGEIVIFNRSHYEDVLVVRVHELVPERVWRKRYEEINNFERMLHDEGTTILKFYLHINQEEQRQRLLDRLEAPEKRWKFNPADLTERALWKDYMQAYEDALEQTSTDWAPWHIVPANHKWFRNLVVSSVLVNTLNKLNPQPPQPLKEKELEKYQKELKNE